MEGKAGLRNLSEMRETALWDVVCVFGEKRWRVIKIGERQRGAERRRGRLGARDDRGR